MRGGRTKELGAILKEIAEKMLVLNKESTILAASWNSNVHGDEQHLIGDKLSVKKAEKEFADWFCLAEKCIKSGQKEILTGTDSIETGAFLIGIPLFKKQKIAMLILVEINLRKFYEAVKCCRREGTIAEHEAKEATRKAASVGKLIYQSKKMTDTVELAMRVAQQDITVLIQGESGTGKEMIARLIYECSSRSDKPFIKINCGAIPENLLESELFGYERGAFTGARETGKAGLFEAADGGTLFLDEIGTMPLHLQVKLLRVIQEKEIMRVGGTNYIQVDIRIIAATNENLKEAVEQGRFREDLYYRLNVIPITIAPLRERKSDIHPLADFFLKKFNRAYHTEKKIDESAWKMMYKYNWPGNVRELENLVERLVVTTDRKTINGADVGALFSDFQIESNFEKQIGTDLKDRVENYERRLILSQMQYYSRSQELADALGIDKSTLTRKMKKYRIKNIYVEGK